MVKVTDTNSARMRIHFQIRTIRSVLGELGSHQVCRRSPPMALTQGWVLILRLPGQSQRLPATFVSSFLIYF